MLGELSLSSNGTAVNMVYKDQNSPINSAYSTLCIDTLEKKIYRVAFGPYLRHDKSNSLSDRTMVFSYDFSEK